MKRSLKLSQEVGDIVLWDDPPTGGRMWAGTDGDALEFRFVEPGVQGLVSLSLDMAEGVEYEIGYDERGREVDFPIGCRRIALMIEGECDQTVSEEEFLETARRLVDRYVNRMISYLRVELSHHWLKPVPMTEWSIDKFLHETRPMWVEGDEETPVWLGRALILVVGEDTRFDERTPGLRVSRRDELWNFVQEGIGPAPERELMASAKQHFVAQEYGVAAVEAVSALEVGVERFLIKRYKAMRIAKKYKDVGGQIGVSMLLKLLLPVELSEAELGCCRGLINRCDKLRKVRNEVVHEATMPVPGEVSDIRHGIKAAEQLLDFVEGLDR